MCIPGLHITLGIYLKLFNLLEDKCHAYDIKIAAILANHSIELDTDFGDFVSVLTRLRVLQREISDKEQQLEDCIEQANWHIISQEGNAVNNEYVDMISNLEEEIRMNKEKVEELTTTNQLTKGTCSTNR